MVESEKEQKSLLMKVSGELKSWLKAQPSENEDHGIRSHHFMGNRWGNSGNSVRFYFGGLPSKGNANVCSNYPTIALISHAGKVMLKILQARLQQYMNHELPDVQAGFRKGRGTRDQIANIHWIIEKAREFQENISFCFIDCAKAFDCVDHNKLKNSEKDGNTSPPDLPLEKSVCRSGSNSCNWSWNNRLVPNRERSMSKLYIVTMLI